MKSNRIAELRKKRNLTLAELSQLTGLSVGYLCHLENGSRSNPSMHTIEKICKALNVSLNDIFNS